MKSKAHAVEMVRVLPPVGGWRAGRRGSTRWRPAPGAGAAGTPQSRASTVVSCARAQRCCMHTCPAPASDIPHLAQALSLTLSPMSFEEDAETPPSFRGGMQALQLGLVNCGGPPHCSGGNAACFLNLCKDFQQWDSFGAHKQPDALREAVVDAWHCLDQQPHSAHDPLHLVHVLVPAIR